MYIQSQRTNSGIKHTFMLRVNKHDVLQKMSNITLQELIEILICAVLTWKVFVRRQIDGKSCDVSDRHF